MSGPAAVAIVGMACEFPDARSPGDLWENVLARRRAFRRMPPERLDLRDYFAADRDAPDKTYATEAAVIRDYAFDRVGFRVSGESFRAADPVHWLALDVAARALGDAGFPGGDGLPRETTGVYLGNTLTGEFARAQVLRLRWPYARRAVDAALADEGWGAARRRAFLAALEARYKAPFAPVGAETLAGGLSNTIAGRVCNHFDLKGGGQTIDGACASSLLAVAHACAALTSGELEVALAGGVDLSLDPFELVGFAKAGALAGGMMRVFDARSDGFWPGEGCGVVVLMRADDARARGLRVLATVPGWGVSSDGRGGLTRPEADGQLLALRRAYRRAGFGIETVGYFEGHGTGTAVGDSAELRALGMARREADPSASAAAVGSVKANLGHAKAAAGVAGLIKAVMAVGARVVPPATGCDQPHPEFTGPAPALRLPADGEPWPEGPPPRAGVSAMGFGGINAHVVVEGAPGPRRRGLDAVEARLLRSYQDGELFLFAAADPAGLRVEAARLRARAAGLSRAELTDAAHAQARRVEPGAPARGAAVASSPAELARRLDALLGWLDGGVSNRLDARGGVFLGTAAGPPRLGLLFPGQGSPASADGGLWARRFEAVRRVYGGAALEVGDPARTDRAQPAIVAASLAALAVLDRAGVAADVAVGHSLGELSALQWAGALDGPAALRVAAARGRAMAALGPGGAMAGLAAGRDAVAALLDGDPVVIAGHNSPRQTVVSGPDAAVARVVARAMAGGIAATRLPIGQAFHSPMVAGAVPALAEALRAERLSAPSRRVVSTVTGAAIGPDDDPADVLLRQVTAPVRFREALAACPAVDLWVEAGPGHALRGLAADCGAGPAVALDAGGPSLLGLLAALGAAFALGAPVRPGVLFDDRFTRPFDPEARPRFFASPCEPPPDVDGEGAPAPAPVSAVGGAVIEVVRRAVAARAELPAVAVRDDHRLLGDLHLNSITVGQLAAEAGRSLGLPPPVSPTRFADVTVADLARALEEQARGGPAFGTGVEAAPPGVEGWVRAFAVEWVERPGPGASADGGGGAWRVVATDDHPLAAALRDAFGNEEFSSINESKPNIVTPGGERPELLPPSPRAAGRGAGGEGPLRRAPSAPCTNPLTPTLSPLRGARGTDPDAPHQKLCGRPVGGGVVVALPDGFDERSPALLLDAARAAGPGDRFVVVGGGGGGAAFARSMHMERPGVDTVVIDVPADYPGAAAWVAAEARAGRGYAEARYDRDGRRSVPVLRHVPTDGPTPEAPPVGPGDVVLVTGGGKGIGAECALALARRTGAKLGVLGRSRPEDDPALAANLRRFAAAGVACHYARADVTIADEVRRAVAGVAAALGPVAGVVHAAGVNAPCALADLDEAAFLRTVAPKVAGLSNVLAAVDADRLRLLAAFGSVIARTGMRGEADYAAANAWQTDLTERFAAGHPACRCLALEWSVWASVGMGERLGRVEALAREGVGPIPTEAGTDLFVRLVSQPLRQTAVLVAGRLGEPPTLAVDRPPMPAGRFLQRVRVDYPGVELVADADLGTDADPYLDDHVFRGERLLPAVVGLEAMAQAAAALLRDGHVRPVVRDVHFDRPVTVPASGTAAVRLAALARDSGHVAVVLRCEATGFAVDHFRATFDPRPAAREADPPPPDLDAAPLPIDPARDLYGGGPLFHGGRFRRVAGYRLLRARECLAGLSPGDGGPWFGPGVPGALVLGDPAARDALVHAVQACIPHATLLPVGVDRVVIDPNPAPGPRFVHARERSSEGDLYVYDVVAYDPSGRACERWDGLRLRAVQGARFAGPWPLPLLGPYLERQARALVPWAEVAFTVGPASPRGESGHRRPDGKPEPSGGLETSRSHAAGLTLSATGPGPLGCDAEPVVARAAGLWRDLLGPRRFALAEQVVRETVESLDRAATRVWAASECLEKAGAADTEALVFGSVGGDGWVLLRCGSFAVATGAARLLGEPGETVFAVALAPPAADVSPARWYEYRHVVGFEETNLLGNVYYANHVRWQGRCRELFLRDHAPSVLDDLAAGLAMVTTHVSCEYLCELRPFDEVSVRMALGSLGADRLDLDFEYWRLGPDGSSALIARGRQGLACLLRPGSAPAPLPPALVAALVPFKRAPATARPSTIPGV